MGILSTVWSLGAGGCIALGLVNLLSRRSQVPSRRIRGFGWAILTLFSACTYVLMETSLWRVTDIGDVGFPVRGMQLALAVFIISLTWFISQNANVARKWLAWTITYLWVVCLFFILWFQYGLWFYQITEIQTITLPWQESYNTLSWQYAHRWKFLSDVASMVFLIYLCDTALQWCRHSSPRMVKNIGGGGMFFLCILAFTAALRHWGQIQLPSLLSPVLVIIACTIGLSLQSYVKTEETVEQAAVDWKPTVLEETPVFEAEPREEQDFILEQEVKEEAQDDLDTKPLVEVPELPQVQEEPISEPEPVTITVPEPTPAADAAVLELELALSEMTYKHARLEAENAYLKYLAETTTAKDRMIGDSPIMKALWQHISEIAESKAKSVLITGPAGSGKELVVQRLHTRGPRSHRTMVTVRCSTLSAGELDTALFGTSAKINQGKLSLAHGSTLFLDEIGGLPLSIQDKLLDYITDSEADDLHIIATTRCSIDEKIESGRFLQDLLDCLNEESLAVPALTEREDDIPLLVHYWLDRIAKQQGKGVKRVSKLVMRRLQSYPWPGNVRELKNIIERAVIASEGTDLKLPGPLIRWPEAAQAQPKKPVENVSGMKTLAEIQGDYILKVLTATQGKLEGKSGAASILGLKPSTLRNRMRKLGVSRSQIPLEDIQPPVPTPIPSQEEAHPS